MVFLHLASPRPSAPPPQQDTPSLCYGAQGTSAPSFLPKTLQRFPTALGQLLVVTYMAQPPPSLTEDPGPLPLRAAPPGPLQFPGQVSLPAQSRWTAVLSAWSASHSNLLTFNLQVVLPASTLSQTNPSLPWNSPVNRPPPHSALTVQFLSRVHGTGTHVRSPVSFPTSVIDGDSDE